MPEKAEKPSARASEAHQRSSIRVTSTSETPAAWKSAEPVERWKETHREPPSGGLDGGAESAPEAGQKA